MSALGDYLLAATRTRWKAGEHDCSAWPARWAGVPIPAYSTDEEGQTLVERSGGLVAVWERAIGDRFSRANEPKAGDVGIVPAIGPDEKHALVGAIYTGERWAFLTPRRVMFAPTEAVAVWRVPCPRP